MITRVADAETVVEPCRPAAGDRPPEVADTQGVDRHLEDVAWLRAAHGNGADQRVTGVELRVTRLELRLARSRVPAGVEARERDRVAAVDLDDRVELWREVTVQRPPFEWDLVDHARDVPIHASRGASRTRRPARCAPSWNSWSD